MAVMITKLHNRKLLVKQCCRRSSTAVVLRTSYFWEAFLLTLFYSILQAVRRIECLTGFLVSLVILPPGALSLEPRTQRWLVYYVRCMFPSHCARVPGKGLHGHRQHFSVPLHPDGAIWLDLANGTEAEIHVNYLQAEEDKHPILIPLLWWSWNLALKMGFWSYLGGKPPSQKHLLRNFGWVRNKPVLW